MFRGYEDVLPGSADRIICMAENEQRHRVCSESKALSNHNLSIKLGAMSTLSAIAAAVLLVSSNGIVGIVAAGGILCLLAIATIVNAVSGPKSP